METWGRRAEKCHNKSLRRPQAWVAWIERALQTLGTENSWRKIIRIHQNHWFTIQTPTLTMFELDCDSQFNNSPLRTLWCLHELNVFAIALLLKKPCLWCLCVQSPVVKRIAHIHLVHLFGTLLDFLTLNSGPFSEWKELSFTLSPVDFWATVWEHCFAMCRTENKSIYQPGWFIKLWKQRGYVNTKCIVNVQIIFHTQCPLYKLDTSIICCSAMVSTSDVSRKQIGET